MTEEVIPIEAKVPKKRGGARPPRKPYAHSMSFKQRAFVKEYIKTGAVGESAKTAGLTPTYGTKLKNTNPKVQKAIVNALEKAGVNDELIADTVAKGLKATTPPVEGGERGGGRPEWPDFGVRREYLDFAAKVRGDYAPELREDKQVRLEITVDLNTLRGMAESGVLDDIELVELAEIEAKARREANAAHQSPVASKTQAIEAEILEKA